MTRRRFPAMKIQQHGQDCILSALPVNLLTIVAYSATRGESNHPNAVQRVLRQDRIEGIKEFVLKGGYFPGSIVLNWDSAESIDYADGALFIDVIPESAQIIDGQHRVAGLREAMNENEDFAQFYVPVTIFIELGKRESADIFLSINTMQKPIPASLVHDLFGVASEHIIDFPTVRARDIAEDLNSDFESPYFEEIKFPGSRRRKGGIPLSTAVSAIKPLVEKNGLFEQNGISDFKDQAQIIKNFFHALRLKYGSMWGSQNDVFYYSSGFSGALEFFEKKMLPYCISKGSFKPDTIARSLTLEGKDLVLQEEVKGLSGKDASKLVSERLNSYFRPENRPAAFEI